LTPPCKHFITVYTHYHIHEAHLVCAGAYDYGTCTK